MRLRHLASRRNGALAVGLALTGAFGGTAELAGQGGPDAARDMNGTLERFLSAWTGDDATALEAVLSPDGVTLRLDEDAHGPVRPRQAAVALRQYMGERRDGRFRVERVQLAGGEPARGFAEVAWTTVVRGTSEPLGYTVFVGLTRSGQRWTVHEVRILR